jgi:hypothetical protein
MVERRCREWSRCRVAVLAGVRQACGNVVHRRRGIVKVGGMARITVDRRIGISRRVALCALKIRVFSRQWETRSTVVESRAAPAYGRVTLSTGMRESARHVRWACRLREIIIVARVAIRAQLCSRVRVARGALNRGVCAGQRKSRRRVVERGSGPRCNCMAALAVRRKSS